MRARLLLDAIVPDEAEPLLRKFDLGPVPPGTRRPATVREPAELSLRARISRVNRGLWELGRVYHDSLPIDAVESMLTANGLEGGEALEGVYTGRDGRSSGQLSDASGSPIGQYLHMSWHKMEETGHWEFTAYIS